MTIDPVAGGLALLVVAVVALWVWYHFVGRKRLIQDLPTSSVRGVSLGLNELVGKAWSDRAEISPHGAYECVWWKATYYVESGEKNQWKKTGERVGGPVFFELSDDTGRITIWPQRAEIRGTQTYDGDHHAYHPDGASLVERHLSGTGGGRRRVVEEVVPVGAPIYVLGTARVPEDRPRPEITADAQGQHPFIVHVGTEADAVWVERLGMTGSSLAAWGAAGWAGWLAGGAWGAVGAVGGVLTVMGMLSFVFAYNNLVLLSQRVQAAWGLIDIQLRRRHDLIPRLVSLVQLHREHEYRVQTALAQLRASVAAELPDTPSDMAVRLASHRVSEESLAVQRVVALVEAYPEVRADGSFRALQAALVDTEDRIALARAFYNNSVRAYRDRARVFPGAIIAGFLPYEPREVFADGDEVVTEPPVAALRSASTADLTAALRTASRQHRARRAVT